MRDLVRHLTIVLSHNKYDNVIGIFGIIALQYYCFIVIIQAIFSLTPMTNKYEMLLVNIYQHVFEVFRIRIGSLRQIRKYIIC